MHAAIHMLPTATRRREVMQKNPDASEQRNRRPHFSQAGAQQQMNIAIPRKIQQRNCVAIIKNLSTVSSDVVENSLPRKGRRVGTLGA